MKKDMTRLLLMGPLLNKKSPEIAGGAIVLFAELLKELQKSGADHSVIDTNKKNYANLLMAYLSILMQLLFRQKGHTHIALHSSRDYLFLGLATLIIARVFKKKVSLRKFGGEAARTYEESRGMKRYLLDTIFSRTDTLFFETRYLVEYFSKINVNTFWFPNVRERHLQPDMPRRFQKRFVFISHVIREKGIDEIVEACKRLDESYTVDIFGPIMDSKYSEAYFEAQGVSYKGALESTDVLKRLNEYDVVLLPSYKEGYPGIVIEAYSLGIPVITTCLPAIKEIVESYKTGDLIKPESIDELVDAIKYFDDSNHSDMSLNAYTRFEDFESTLQTQKYLERI